MTLAIDIDAREPAIRTIQPRLPTPVMVKLNAFIETKRDEGIRHVSKLLRKLADVWRNEVWALELRATALVLADLMDQGWTVTPADNRIHLAPPGMRANGESAEGAKRRLRAALQIGQERQLNHPSVSRFLHHLSGKASHNKIRSSALDVVDDGAALASIFARIASLSDEQAEQELRGVIEPVIEVCDESARCDVTGIRLLDLWRYFRHTWSLEYRSIPGRQLPLLIRNAARPGRPIIGIAMLASPVLKTRPRDNWLGWTPEPFVARVRPGAWNAKVALRALMARVDKSIKGIRHDDLVTSAEIRNPTERVVFRLEQKAEGAAVKRQRQLEQEYSDALEAHGRARSQIDPTKRGTKGIDWKAASKDLLFVRKRTEALARLLDAKRVFQALNWKSSGRALLDQLLATEAGYKALSVALQEVRNAALASQVADLSVCGAVPPYNCLLGGKLVALAVASQEARNAWKKRYERQISVISSQVAGKAIRRPADLKVLTTTSLYGLGSSQYNRLKLNVADFPQLKGDIVWHKLERTAGFGTVHLSSETVKILREVTEKTYKSRRVNNRFGEGTSPRLRQIRDGLDVLGITSNDILHHATPRLFYACALTPDADRQLLGIKAHRNGHAPKLSAVAEAWRQRWLLSR
ncbi:MAG: Druantia anti-phage system protein DruA, partial [Terriglobales bacterium]